MPSKENSRSALTNTVRGKPKATQPGGGYVLPMRHVYAKGAIWMPRSDADAKPLPMDCAHIPDVPCRIEGKDIAEGI